MDSPLQRAMAALSNVYQTGKERALNAMQAAQNRGVVGNITDALKGAGRAYSADIAGTPVDVRNMVSGALSPEGGGNPYASAIRNLIGPPDEKYSSDYFAKNLGIEGEGLAYDLGNMLGPEAAKAALRNITRPSVLNIFAGERAANAPLDKLTRAKEMDMATEAPEDIWKETGWFKGADEQWRWEIPDKPAKLSPKGFSKIAQEHNEQWEPGTKHAYLEDVLKHPQLFEAYPELKNMRVGNVPGWNLDNEDWLMYFDPEKRYGTDPKFGINFENYLSETLKLWQPERFGGVNQNTPDLKSYRGFPYTPKSLEDLTNQILHETQHAVQNAEQFGSIPNKFYGEDPYGFTEYFRNPHEVEARAVQSRFRMSPKQLRETFPFESYDVPIQDLDIP